MKFLKKNLYGIILIAFVSALPFLSFAQTSLVKCGTPTTNPCGFNDILILINTVVKFIFTDLAIPIAAIMFAYAGFELVTSGGSTEKKSQAKKIFINVALGLIFVAAAYLIVHEILVIAGVNTVDWNWFGF